MDNSSKNISLNHKRYRRLKISFWGHWFGFGLIYLLYATYPECDPMFVISIVLFICACSVTYLATLGALVAEARKSVITWVGGTIVFNWIGFIVSYVKIKSVAIENGWDI